MGRGLHMIIYYLCNSDNALLLSFLLTCHPYIPFHHEMIFILVDYKHDPRLQMREDTRQILEEFFQPYNQMLAELLGDDKFLWK